MSCKNNNCVAINISNFFNKVDEAIAFSIYSSFEHYGFNCTQIETQRIINLIQKSQTLNKTYEDIIQSQKFDLDYIRIDDLTNFCIEHFRYKSILQTSMSKIQSNIISSLIRHDMKINYLTYFDKNFAKILIEKYNLNTNTYQIFERLSNTQEIKLVVKSLKLKLFHTDNPKLQFEIFCNDDAESILHQIKFI